MASTGLAAAGPANPPTPQIPLGGLLVSTVFFQGAPLLPYEADTNLLSSDGVIFCVHSAAILAKSNNGFASLLTPNRNASTGPSTSRNDHPLVRVTEPFATINIVLHTVYDISCAPFAPQVPALTAAIKALIKYGISLHAHIAPGTPLFVVLAAHIPGHALELYALAAEHDLYELARPASTHLIGRRLVDIPEAAVVQMGPLYLKQILALKQGRLSALKALLAEPPDAHPYTATCDESKQQNLRNAWTLASAYLIWEMRPEITAVSLDFHFAALAPSIICPTCLQSFQRCLATVVNEWAAFPRTI